MPDPGSLLGIISIVISIFVVIGGFAAYRSGFFKQSSEIQNKTIDALQARVGTLEKEREDDAKEIKRLRTIINTVRYALKRKGMLIEIDGDYVTLVENGQSKSTRMRPPDDPTGKVRPLNPKNGAEEDEDDVS